jgi:lipopolysaccharide transport system permease protein
LGLGFFLSAANVYLRDIRHMVAVGLSLLFYLSPIFYSIDSVPEAYRSIISVNPITHLLDAYRAILIEGRLPDLGGFASLSLIAAVVSGLGYMIYRGSSKSFLDEL